MVEAGLALRGETNDQFARAVCAMCEGMYDGALCGLVTGAACMLGLFAPDDRAMISEMTQIFREEILAPFGSMECSAITGGDPYKKISICPELKRKAVERATKLLAEYGYIEEEV